MPDTNPNIVNPESIQDQIPGEGYGKDPMSPRAISFLAAYLIVVALGLLAGLYYVWNKDAAVRSAQEKPRKTSSDTIEPSHGPVSGGTAVRITGAQPFPAGAKLRFDGTEVMIDPVANDPKVLRAVAPRHDAGRVIVDVVDKDTKKLVSTFFYTYGSLLNPWLFLLVILAGGLGASLHALRSLYWYTGNRKLVQSWLLMYLLLPLTGALMATVFYLVISAGLMTPEQANNPLIAVGIAVIVGMFSREAAEKLESIADAVLTKASNGADAGKDSHATLQVIAVDPPSGKTAGGEKVTVKGIGFSGSPTVLFDSSAAASVSLTSPTSLTVVTPPHAAGMVDVTVKTVTTSAKAEKAFTYIDGQVAPANEPAAGGGNVPPGGVSPATGGHVVPAEGSKEGGKPVTITGTGFIKDATTVTFGGTPAKDVSVTSSTSLTAITPPHEPGKVDVVVTSGGKSVLTLTEGYFYQEAS